MRGGVVSAPCPLRGTAFVYREGGTQNPARGIYTTLAAAVGAAGPGGLVLIDGSLGTPTTQAVAYNIDGLTFAGVGLIPTTLSVVEGTTFTAPTFLSVVFRTLAISWAGATAPFTLVAPLGISLELYATIAATSGASGAFVLNTDQDLYINIGFGCGIVGSSGHPVINLGASNSTGFCEVNVLPTVAATDEIFTASVSANAITGGRSAALTVTNLSAGLTAGGGLASISHTQTGTISPTYLP